MVVKCMQLFVILLTLSLFGAVLLSFGVAKFPKADQIPDRFTGYPTWHGDIKEFDPSQQDSINALSVVLMLITGIVGAKLVSKPPSKQKLTRFFVISNDSDVNVTGVSTFGFNRLLVLYVWATMITVFTAVLVDVGKLFSAIGIFHNSVEVATLFLIGGGGKIKSNSFFGGLLFYILTSCTIVVLLKFPNDAAFFKFQGLCMDFALVIEYIRIYFTTKDHIRDAERETLPPLNVDEDNNDNNNDGDEKSFLPIFPTTIEYPNNLKWLLLASGVHLIGNILDTILFSYAMPLYFFELSYATTFPLYIYHVYLDTQADSVLTQKRIYLPETPKWKAIVIGILSMTGSLLAMRISFMFNS